MKHTILFIFFVLYLLACGPRQTGNPLVEIQTRLGDIVVELYPGQAPLSVARFLSNVDSGYYENSFFYRVLNDGNQPSNAGKAALIQGGLWKSRYKTGERLPGIPHESTQRTNLKHTDGTLSFARQEPGTAKAEFFIVIGDQPGLDYGGTNNPDGQGYAAFGKVIQGLAIVYKIQQQPEYEQTLDPLIPIYKIIRY